MLNDQIAKLKKTCPRADVKIPTAAAVKVPEKELAEVAKRATDARTVSRELKTCDSRNYHSRSYGGLDTNLALELTPDMRPLLS